MTGASGAEEVGAARSRSVPPWRGIAGSLAEEIAQGVLSGQLPGERVLCDRYGASRATVRRALKLLADSGLITAAWGRGWYVGDRRLSEPPNSLMSFSDLALESGLSASSRVLSLRKHTAGVDCAALLRVAPGAPVLLLERLRLLDGVPMLWQESTLPLTRLAELDGCTEDDFTGSLYRLLEESCGVAPVRADFTVEARPAEARAAELLHIEPGSALLWTSQTTYDVEGRPIELGFGAYPHERYRFRASLVRSPLLPLGTTRRRPGGPEPARQGPGAR